MTKTIATLGSHCALQLLKGAKDEGMKNIIITEKKRETLYRRFHFIDQYIVVDQFSEITLSENQKQLMDCDAILIPHGTLISEVGVEKIEKELNIPIFGNRWILRWEADRILKEKLMATAGLKPPRSFSSPDEIHELCIVKLPGAAGGRGYFLASSPIEFQQRVKTLMATGFIKPGFERELYIQEYCVGVPVYLQYFYSPLNEDVELLGIDRRYETTADSLGRIPSHHQEAAQISPSYIVVGNIPLVLRESLLDEAYRIGEDFVRAASRLVPPGMVGPFCIEGVYDETGRFVPIEF
jgi:5-formaminoimidazole-4-carboxamide-1-(beta)-D-ribofuranosyl 5'-monophosphate synthetase